MEGREKAVRVAALLEREYGRPEWQAGGDPLDQLIHTVLSQNTSDTNSGRAYAALRARFPDWEAVLAAPEAEVARAITPGGLAQIKSGRIQSILRQIQRQQGRLDLSFLREMPSEAVHLYLTRFAGVGEKTAACVLLFALGRPVLPVDTHVLRVSQRLGLVGPATNAEKAHAVLGALMPEDAVYAFHINAIRHGRQVCRSSHPRCERCVLQAECSAYRSPAPR